MAEKAGRPRVLIRRHVLEIKEDTQAWIVEQLDAYTDRRTYGRTSRVIGAGIAATGIYFMVKLIDEFGRGVADAAKKAFTEGPLPTGGQPGLAAINYFISVFAPGDEEAEKDKGRVHERAIETLKELGRFDPFAFGAALTAGGMVLAGLNPGEILKGIGSIIDAIIPL